MQRASDSPRSALRVRVFRLLLGVQLVNAAAA